MLGDKFLSFILAPLRFSYLTLSSGLFGLFDLETSKNKILLIDNTQLF